MSVFDANLTYLPYYVLNITSLISFLEDINDQNSHFVEKTTFHPIKFSCEKRDGHSKRERMEIIDLHLNRVFAGSWILLKINCNQFLK